LIFGLLGTGTSCQMNIKGSFLSLKVDEELFEFKDAACVYANGAFAMTIGKGAVNTLGF